jgi:S-adenosyl methyltransferase
MCHLHVGWNQFDLHASREGQGNRRVPVEKPQNSLRISLRATELRALARFLGTVRRGSSLTEGVTKRGHPASGPEPVIDTSVAHSARVHDYWLGGTNNFPADRAAGDAVMEAYPGIVMSVRANRAFLARVVRFLAAEPRSRVSSTAWTWSSRAWSRSSSGGPRPTARPRPGPLCGAAWGGNVKQEGRGSALAGGAYRRPTRR